MDRERLEELKAHLADRFTPVELCELLGLTEWQLLDMFEEEVMHLKREDYT